MRRSMEVFEKLAIVLITIIMGVMFFNILSNLRPNAETEAIKAAVQEEEWLEVTGKSVFSNAFTSKFRLETKVSYPYKGEDRETELSYTVTEEMFNQAKVGDMFNPDTYELKSTEE